MSRLPVAYLSMDALGGGVAMSQVVPYLLRLADRGFDMTVHSFEPAAPSSELQRHLETHGVRWTPHSFGRPGPIGGLQRTSTAAWFLRGSEFVHARSDMAAAAASFGDRPWLWDIRTFFADQRIETGTLRAGSIEERALRRIERRAARRSAAIVSVVSTSVPVLVERHGPSIAAKCHVIPNCVDLTRFRPEPLPAGPTVFVLAGTLNAYYDVPLMLELHQAFARRHDAILRVVAPAATHWDREFAAIGAERATAQPADMPGVLTAGHVGLSVCRLDAGISMRSVMPVKIAEFLAAGRPVVVNAGLTDVAEVVARTRSGVVVRDGDHRAVEGAIDELEVLLADPATPERCRRAAEDHYDLERGADLLAEAYRVAMERST
jgi:glycosyltransferase involved in cell wall biosynthesis